MRWHGWIASWVVMVAVALAAAGSCWAEGEVVAPPAPGPGVEDQYDELLGNILGPMAGAPAAGVSNPLGSADGGPAAPGAQLSAEEWAR
ncbi:MAG: hypothetical protein GX100_07240, partial [candidate division WS1 bacterium]|nr:hypothetical protein [candidate division WS1 bacterium]